MKRRELKMKNYNHMPGIVHTEKTDFTHPSFKKLVSLLDEDLAIRDGDDHSFYAQFNKIDALKNVVLLWYNNEAIGCGAFKPIDEGTVEVKRMYVSPSFRGRGMALTVLTELEQWAASLRFTRCILETGLKQPEAIKLYTKAGYIRIVNYGQYAGVENSVCFEKMLAS